MSDAEFILGESLIWSSRNRPDEMVTKRPVSFRGWKNNMCVVAYGLRPDGSGEPFLYSVRKEELARPVPHRQLKPAPTPEPAPIVSLEQRRHALRLRYDSYVEAQTEVGAAQELLDRALSRVEQAETERRNYHDLEKHAIDAVLHELRHVNGNGHCIADDDQEFQARYRAESDCASAQGAYDALARELSDTKTIASERLNMLQSAASFVVAGILEREIERLENIEMEAAELRTQLRAASMMWFSGQAVPVSPSHSKVLVEPPTEVHEGIGERLSNNELRQQHYAELFTQLVSGDVNADLPCCIDDDDDI